MNKLTILFLTIVCMMFYSCIGSNASLDDDPFDWLLGEWKRVKKEEKNQLIEQWKKKGNDYEGIGFYALENGDTSFTETMKLSKKNTTWYLDVVSQADNQLTIFEVTTIDSKRFTCENDSNSFPKKIKYWLESEKSLRAEIANDSIKVLFYFDKNKWL